MDDNLRIIECAICYSYPLSAQELNCCEQIICKLCLDQITVREEKCPLCRKLGYKADPVRGALRRLIESMSIPCPNNCGLTIKIGNVTDHNKLCPNKPVVCKFCRQEFKTNAFFEHLQSVHVVEVTSLCGQNGDSNSTNVNSDSSSFSQTSGDLKSLFPVRNNANSVIHPKLGTTGKFYCGKRLDIDCGCCNGYCGPTNGCNCSHCQKLDIQFRRLGPGFYVNSQGAMSYRDSSTFSSTFYCMRISEFPRQQNVSCDGVSQNTCRSCRGLNSAWNASDEFRFINPLPIPPI